MSRSGLSSIEKEVKDQLERYFPDIDDPFFVIAVSGGIDSMSLLYSFHRLQISALAVHINYGKRGEASDKDAELVEQIAYEWGFDCQTINADPSDAEGKNFQQWARRFRYDVFRSLAGEYNADGIALAHHRDDQIETILQKMFRGAGLASWTGMEVWDEELFRPLLNISQQEINDYAGEKAVPYRVDASNLESDFARNFLRNEWLEDLENHFPGWKSNVLRMAEQAEIFQHALSRLLDQITDPEKGISRRVFHTMEPGLQKALLLHAIKQKDRNVSVSAESLERVEDLESLQTGKAVEPVPGVSIVRNRGWYVIRTEREVTGPVCKLQIDGGLKEGINFEGLQFILRKYEEGETAFERELYIDAEKMSWPLNVRRWTNGDRFQPLGMEGHQHVADHLTNRKANAAEKHTALVIESFEERIVAVIFPPIEKRQPPGTIADHVKCDSSTTLCLNIKHGN